MSQLTRANFQTQTLNAGKAKSCSTQTYKAISSDCIRHLLALCHESTGQTHNTAEGKPLLDCVFNYMLYIKSFIHRWSQVSHNHSTHTNTHTLTHIKTHSEWAVVAFLICALSPEGHRRWFNPIYTPPRSKMNTT